MPKQTSLWVPNAIKDYSATISSGDSFIAAAAASPHTAPTNTKLLMAASANDTNVKSLIISSDSTSAHIVQIWRSLDGGTTKHLLFAVNVPIGSGFLSGTTVNIDVLGSTIVVGLPLDMSGRPYLPMASGSSLYVGVTIAAVAANKTIYVNAISEDY